VPGSRRSPSGDNSLPPGTGGDSDLGGAPQQTAKLRTIIQQVADGAASARQAASESSAAKQTAQETGASRNRTTIADARAEGPIGQPAAASLLLEEIERNAGGLRRPALETIEPAEMGRLRQEFADLGGDPEMLRFNQGTQTGYLDRGNIIVM
jgi:hypothetical protein